MTRVRARATGWVNGWIGGVFLKERVTRLIVPMFFGAWTMGFAGSVILGNEDMSPSGLTLGFLFGIIWRSLVFWVPIFGQYFSILHT